METTKLHKLYILLLLCTAPSLCIYADNDPEDENRSHYTWEEKWYFQAQGGINYLAAENTRFVSFSKILSPSYALAIGKKFTPLWGMRIQFMEGKDKGVYYARQKDSPLFSFRHHGIIIEGTFNAVNFLRQNRVGYEKKWNVDLKLGLGYVHSASYELSDAVIHDSDYFPDGKHRDNFAIYAGVDISRKISKTIDVNVELGAARMGNKYNGQVCRDASAEIMGDALFQVLVGIRYTIPVKKPCKERVVYINNPVYIPIQEEKKVEVTSTVTDTIPTQDCYTVEELLLMVEKGISIKGQRLCNIEMVYFDFDKSVIKPEFAEYLDKLSALMHNQPDIRLLIMGHTDSKGSVEYNYALSERRSKAVLEYLNNKGIANNRMVYKYYSKLHPLTENTTDQGCSINRRVQFMILP